MTACWLPPQTQDLVTPAASHDPTNVRLAIEHLQQRLEAIRQYEVERARGALSKLSPAQRLQVEELTVYLISKILQSPASLLAKEACEPHSQELINVIYRVFGLLGDSSVRAHCRPGWGGPI